MKKLKLLILAIAVFCNQLAIINTFAKPNIKTPDQKQADTETKEAQVLNENLSAISNRDLLSEEHTSFINVKLPYNLDFEIDPYNAKERGQIYSEDYVFVNNSNVDVLVTIDRIVCQFSDGDSNYKLLSSEEDIQEISPYKELYLYLKNVTSWSDEYEDEYLISTSDIQSPLTSFTLLAGKKYNMASFRLMGAVNKIPEINWESNTVKLIMNVSCRPILDEAPKSTDSNAQPDITSDILNFQIQTNQRPETSTEQSTQINPTEMTHPKESVPETINHTYDIDNPSNQEIPETTAADVDST